MNKIHLSAAAATIVAAVSFAQTPNPATNPGSSKIAPPQFSSLDSNRDGRVSKDEVKAHAELTSSFANLDADHDTYLSETEFGKWKPATTPGATTPGANRPAPGAPMPGNPGSTPGTRTPAPLSGSPQSNSPAH